VSGDHTILRSHGHGHFSSWATLKQGDKALSYKVVREKRRDRTLGMVAATVLFVVQSWPWDDCLGRIISV